MKYLLKNSICFFVVILVITAACTNNIIYHSFQDVPEEGWNKNNAFFSTIQITDSIPTSYHLYVQIRFHNNYPYQNLLFFVSHNLQDSSVIVTDTIKYMLTGEYKRRIEKGGGSLFQETFDEIDFTVHYPGTRTIKIAHGMQDEILTGINDIGIWIERIEQQ
ncbi:hypothetical protein EZS27_033006 [termite gut metagenome]|uniref:Gliding motility lipoprotein GldH n=1 Tax=termite gut metagenome TaxID=433724 RepID=A0A5J4Q510_9ZZZZ